MIFITAITVYCLWVYVYSICTFLGVNLLLIHKGYLYHRRIYDICKKKSLINSLFNEIIIPL
jgi:hypothetical protein